MFKYAYSLQDIKSPAFLLYLLVCALHPRPTIGAGPQVGPFRNVTGLSGGHQVAMNQSACIIRPQELCSHAGYTMQPLVSHCGTQCASTCLPTALDSDTAINWKFSKLSTNVTPTEISSLLLCIPHPAFRSSTVNIYCIKSHPSTDITLHRGQSYSLISYFVKYSKHWKRSLYKSSGYLPLLYFMMSYKVCIVDYSWQNRSLELGLM